MEDRPLPSAEELHFAYVREKKARKQAELILQTKTRQAYLANEELKKINIELHQHQRATIQQEKLAALGTLIAGMAHEINNPLAYVMGNIRNLSEYLNVLISVIEKIDSSPDFNQSRLHLIYDEATESFPKMTLHEIIKDCEGIISDSDEGLKRVKSIVQNLKNFARNDDNSRTRHNVHSSVESAITILSNELKNKVVLKVELQQVPEIFVNPNSLTQVLINIINNAIQAFPSGEKGEIAVCCSQNQNRIVLTVADNGCGMDEEVLKNIFVPFFTTKPLGLGTGLGLSICYEKMKEMGGQIEVESEKNNGTRVTLTFPIEQRAHDRIAL